ncbi:MAG: ribose-phosphate diphosphokinase [Pyrobaculum sp.]
MDILAFPNAFDIASELEGLGPVGQIEERVFPDGEVVTRVPDVGSEAAVVMRLFPNVNDNLVKLFLTVDALNDLGARKVVLVLPYLPYARQDRRFRRGEPISSKTMLKIFSSLSVHGVVTIDMHKHYVADYAPRLLVRNIYPAGEFAKLIDAEVVISPDAGSAHRAEAVAKRLGAFYTYFKKFRDRETGAITLTPSLDLSLRGRRVAIVDDILSTGGTLVDACRAARTLGADYIYAVVTHCLLVKDAREKVHSCVDRLICTDTVLNEFAEVKTAPLLREALGAIASSI